MSDTRSDCPLFSEGTTLMRFMRTAAVVVGLIVAVAVFGSTPWKPKATLPSFQTCVSQPRGDRRI